MSHARLFVLCMMISYLSLAQPAYHYTIVKSNTPVNIDGRLDDPIWQKLGVNQAVSSGIGMKFSQTFPTDSLPAIDDTYFMVAYDNEYLYLGAVCFDKKPNEPIIQSLRRDFNWSGNENISFYIDPYNDLTNGFTFQVTPLNVQREGLVTIGGSVADDWDNKWYSATSTGPNYWSAEMAIPFTSIRFNEVSSWGLQVLRNNLKHNERTVWAPVPIQYRSSDLVYAGKLLWETTPPPAGTNISVIPYISYAQAKNYEEDLPTSYTPGVGFDAKIGVSNSLNLDLTINPDFSQVEVDRQVTNLNRFELFFPERRQFFLENQDLFAQNGFPPSRPFFSRRIGLGTDADGLAIQVPILGGARLSGKIGKDWRIGALTMQTKEDVKNYLPGENYSVGILQRQIFNRSNISAIIVNRQTTTDILQDSTQYSSYNRVYGLDYNLASADNKWEGNFYHHQSIDPDPKRKAYSSGAFLGYRVRAFGLRYFQTLIGENYNAEVGFVPRPGVYTHGGGGQLNFYPKDSKIQRHGPDVSYSQVLTPSLDVLDREWNLEWGFNFLNTAYLEAGFNYNTILLTDPFDPSGTEGLELAADENYATSSFRIFARSDNRKLFNIYSSINYGQYFNGNRTRVSSGFDYRWQPYFRMSFDVEYNEIKLPAPYNSASLWLVGPRLDLTFTNNLFWTTFVQYNNQIENLGINTRLQWRFKPVSDFFIVYTDNYATDIFQSKNRALVVKLTYWLNL